MNSIKTLAWVIPGGEPGRKGRALLKKEPFSFANITEAEVLIEPLYGCWEANMSHALERNPMDVCHKRGESQVVLGNAGVVRVLKTGSKVTGFKEGDICVFIPNGNSNRWGILDTRFGFGYDEPGSIGMLAKQSKVFEYQLIPVSKNSTLLLRQFPIISVRYSTAWSNWLVASKCWEAQVSREEYPSPYVCGWGGGVALGELLLAKHQGYNTIMIASNAERLELIKNFGIFPVDRRRFPHLDYDPEKYTTQREYRKRYLASLNTFRQIIHEVTRGEGVSIFIENIGAPVYPATLRMLNRPGVITTAGWKEGMNMEVNRARECHHRHIHVFTHALRRSEGEECVAYAEQHDWIPSDHSPIYDWEDIPQLAQDFANGNISSYFPIFQVNPL